jgi:hypothetical protein
VPMQFRYASIARDPQSIRHEQNEGLPSNVRFIARSYLPTEVVEESDPQRCGRSLASDSGVRVRIGLWFGLGLLVCSGLEFGGRVPPPLSRHWAWERATSLTEQRSKGT